MILFKIKNIKDYMEPSNKQSIDPVICVLGANGQLGKEFIKYFYDINYKNFIGFDKSLDITNKDHIKKLKKIPCGNDDSMRYTDIIINCAAYNDVYTPNENENEKIKCFKTNALGPKYLAEFCKKRKIKLIHFSTNYVFEDGRCTMKSYSEFDEAKPFLFYGFSKYCGENFIKECIPDNSIIIRTAWLFSNKGKITRMLEYCSNNNKVLKIANATGTPTYTLDLVKQTLFLITHKVNGLYHCVNSGCISKKQYIEEIAKKLNLNVKIENKSPGPTMLLKNFMLDMEELNIMQPWQDAVNDCFKKENKE
jgi:dTDP-4-dehydrorhamnose reductase